MCGICGWVGPAGLGVDVEAGRTMRDALTHRGPDGAGEADVAAPGLEGWLGHRRLRIIDLSDAAEQPIAGRDPTVLLNYNGEVYNFRELRRELEGAGHRFRSTSDSEVVVRAYETWGDDCVHRFEGMFAFAIWDGPRGRLLLARDRTGKKPLYYSTEGGRLTFGSEMKALLCAPWVSADVNESAIAEFLAFGYVPNPETAYRGIGQIPPGSLMTYDRDGVHGPRPYWDALPREQVERVDDDSIATFARLLEEATARRMISDVPLGALLSGGVDSSVVVALMQRTASEPVRTFSIGFSDDASFDETSYARLVAEHLGTRHTEFDVRADSVALLDRLIWHHDHPFGDSSAVPTFTVCQLAREHVTVALNGDGGDEVLGGYDRFRAAAISEHLPGPVVRATRVGTRLLPRSHGYYSLRRRIERLVERAEMPPRARYQSWIAVLNEELLAELVAPRVLAATGGPVTRSMDRCYDRSRDLPFLDQVLYANFKTYLPDDLAVKMDRMSMASSLETRSPFLDTAVVEHLARIPARHKVGLRSVKPLLRRAFRPLLPDEIWKRRKHGFGAPLNRWFEGELGTMFEDEVLASDARTRAYLRPEGVRRLWDEQRAGVGHGFRLWTLLTLERWLRAQERPPAAAPPTTEVLSA